MHERGQAERHRLDVDGRRLITGVKRVAVEEAELAVIKVFAGVGHVVRQVIIDESRGQAAGPLDREVHSVGE